MFSRLTANAGSVIPDVASSFVKALVSAISDVLSVDLVWQNDGSCRPQVALSLLAVFEAPATSRADVDLKW